MKQAYVEGFVSDPTGRLLLIMKNRPVWMAGYLNGIGGKIEEGETATGAMVRECWEETGLEISHERWRPKLILDGPDFIVYFYTTVADISGAVQKTDEVLHVFHSYKSKVDNLYPNLQWILPLVHDKTLQFPIRIVDTVSERQKLTT